MRPHYLCRLLCHVHFYFVYYFFFFFQAEDGIRDLTVTGVQTCALPILRIGIDLGGTKIEAIALSPAGQEITRLRVATPRDYAASLDAIAGLVQELEIGRASCRERV